MTRSPHEASRADVVGRVRALVTLLADPVPALASALAAAEALADREPRLAILDVDPFAIVDPPGRADDADEDRPGRPRRRAPSPAPRSSPGGSAAPDVTTRRGSRPGPRAATTLSVPEPGRPVSAGRDGSATTGRTAAGGPVTRAAAVGSAGVAADASPGDGPGRSSRPGDRAAGERTGDQPTEGERPLDFASLAGPRLDALLGRAGGGPNRAGAGPSRDERDAAGASRSARAGTRQGSEHDTAGMPSGSARAPDGTSQGSARPPDEHPPGAAAVGPALTGDVPGASHSNSSSGPGPPRFALRRPARPAVHGPDGPPVPRRRSRAADGAEPAGDRGPDGVGGVDPEELVDLVAAVLAEQARRHGVDLS